MNLQAKHHTNDATEWWAAIDEAKRKHDVARAERLVETAAEDIVRRLPELGSRAAIGWSGGKDSQALRVVTERAGIRHGMLGISDFDFPEMTRWLARNRPDYIEPVNRPNRGLPWLAQHQDWLFPRNRAGAYKWTQAFHQWEQNRWMREGNADVLILGRRTADANSVGSNGNDWVRKADGTVRWSPLARWSHEDVLTVIAVYDCPLAPIYWWPRAFFHTTPRWPQRSMLAGGERANWGETWAIDPDVVRQAAEFLPGARLFVEASP